MNRNFEIDRKIHNFYTEHATHCKCGHTVYIPNQRTYTVCKWCGQNVFKTSKDEFKYRIREKLNQEKRANL